MSSNDAMRNVESKADETERFVEDFGEAMLEIYDVMKVEGEEEMKEEPAYKAPSRSEKLVFNEGSIRRRRNRVLVTGGCGFIGSHLVDRLMEEGNEVIVVDNCFSGDKANIEKWLDHKRFEFIRHDVIDPIQLEIDQIYHLACPASPVFYQDNPIKTIKTSVIGTMNMLGLAKRTGARILLSSTSEVYGDPLEHPQTEEYWGNVNPIGIRSCYDEGKRIAETLMFEYYRKHAVDIRVARIFNTYGPRMLENDGRVVSNFIVQALKGEPLTVYGEGDQTRSFCYVDDMVDGLIKLMNGDCIGPINIGNPGEYTILELAENIQDIINPDVELCRKPLPSDDPKKRKPDISKARKFLGWEPTVALKEGLIKTIEDFRLRLIASGEIAEDFKCIGVDTSVEYVVEAAAEETPAEVSDKVEESNEKLVAEVAAVAVSHLPEEIIES